MSELKQALQDARKTALKSGDKRTSAVIQLIAGAIKQREVDERIELDDTQIIETLSKMLKQRRDSLQQYKDAGRTYLADQEQFEIDLISNYLPTPLTEAEITQLIQSAIEETNAVGMQDMGKVMGSLKPKLQGRADMGKVSQQIKTLLT